MHDLAELTGLIYDAALDSALWPRVLEEVADAVGAGPAALLSQNQVSKRGQGLTTRLDPAALGEFYGYYALRNPLTRGNDLHAIRAMPRLKTLTDRDVVDKRELMASEYYNSFMRPNGMHSALMIGLALHGENASTVNVMRSVAAGDFDDGEVRIGETLQPHLTRALKLAMRLGEAGQTGEALAEFLDRSAHGVFLIADSGRVCHANSAAEAMLRKRDGLSLANEELAGATPDATRKLRALIAAAVSPSRSGGSLSLPRAPGRHPLSAVIAPVNREHATLFNLGPAAIVCVSDPETGHAPPERRLRDLFGLTRTEAAVALELLAGHDPRAIAGRMETSYNTVRVHLARILAKTRTNRQTELVRLMMRVVGMG
jgi:DNA-binding CsgD family transcriptional regulator/PAS domain-containing protein